MRLSERVHLVGSGSNGFDLTDATRAQVKKLVEAGKTGSEIAKAVGVSLPSVHNIKKALGLVKKK